VTDGGPIPSSAAIYQEMSAADHHKHLEEVCHALGDRLKDLAQKRCSGVLSEQTFIDLVLRIEAEEVAPKGLTLTASNTEDNWTVFNLKINGSNEVCASFEFLPETGEFRRAGTQCD
jgi:hypothetical protein